MKKILQSIFATIFFISIGFSSWALIPGSIAFTGYNADGTDGFSFVTLVDLVPGTVLSFTDGGWNTSTGFRTTEGAFTMTVTTTIPAGTNVAWSASPGTNGTLNIVGAGAATLSSTPGFSNSRPALSSSGDQIIAFEGTAGSPTNIAAIQMNGNWDANQTSTSTSAVPAGLTDGMTCLAISPELDNALFIGASPVNGDFGTLLMILNNPANWTSDNSLTYTLPPNITFNVMASSCSIDAVMPMGQGGCDAITNQFTQFLQISYSNPPPGDLVVNGQSFPMTGSPQTVGVMGPSDGNPFNVLVNFAMDPNCDTTINGITTAPMPCVIPGKVAITEFINNTFGNENDNEWVELFNYGSSPVDIQNWRLQDEDSDNILITSASTIIPSGGFVILTKNKTAFEANWLGGASDPRVIQLSSSSYFLSNSGDEVVLRNQANQIVWTLAYPNGETEGRATYLDYANDMNTTITAWGSKSSPGINRAGNDPASGTLGYESNNSTLDPLATTAPSGDTGSPLAGNYNVCPAPVPTVPTASEWGLILISLITLSMGLMGIRRLRTLSFLDNKA